MILFELFYTFVIIGLFTFGGGYSMIALIEDEVVDRHAWLTAQEFADILAVSQVTPGPVGINTATFAGYSAVVAEGYPTAIAVLGAVIASLAVLVLPLTLILVVGRWLLKHKGQPPFDVIFPILRLTVVGLIAAAAISLMPAAFNFGNRNSEFEIQNTIFSLIIFLLVFVLSLIPAKKKSALSSPITLILLAGLAGALFYGL